MSAQKSILHVAFASYCLMLLVNCCESARILGFFPTVSKSHLIIHTAIAEALAERGHNVTVFQTLAPLKKNTNYKTVAIEVSAFDKKFFSEMIKNAKPLYLRFGELSEQLAKHTHATVNHPKTQQFLSDNKDSFDLIILGYFFNDYYLGLAAYFNCPVVLSFMVQPTYNVNRILGNPSELAYVPSLFSGLKQPLGFMGRVKNFLISMFERIVLDWILAHRTNEIYEKLFPADRYPSLDALLKNVSLVLSNHHFSLGPIRPNVPGLIDVGGIQIKEKPAPLPADIGQILDNAKEGAIYFSLGTNVQGSHLSQNKTQFIFNVLSKLPYTVLWKWGDTDFPGQAKNIIYKSWLPQDDILAHPNVKLFITHGGQGSVVESQYHGVPMVGIPLFSDQPTNVQNVEQAGFGVGVDYINLSEHSFRTAILEVMQNTKYSEAVKEFSKLYSDRPSTSRQTAVFWVEYVLRHRGAKHLKSPAILLNRWQLLSLDVIGFLLTIVFFVIGTIVVLCKYTLRYCYGNSKRISSTKKVLSKKERKKKV